MTTLTESTVESAALSWLADAGWRAAQTWCLFVNGLLLAVIELKNPTDEETTIWTAWQQSQTYKAEIPSLFAFNAAS